MPTSNGIRCPHGPEYAAVAPFNSKQVFARVNPAQNFLADLQVAGQQPQLALHHPCSYVAVFLDDVAVTGKGLLNFIIRAAEAQIEQRPAFVLAIPIATRLSPPEEFLYSNVLRTLGESSKTGPSVGFAYLPLLRHCVKSYLDLDSTSIFRSLLDIERRTADSNPRLKSYLGDVQSRIERIGRDQARKSPGNAICSHPFFPNAEDTFSASIRTIWIRALIALYEQNLAVLGALLHEIREACSCHDATLLTMFCLEPELYNLRPIKRCCSNDLRDLAVHVLENPSAPAAIKSDALTVLLLNELPDDHLLIRAVKGCWHDFDLLCQIIIFLIVNGHSRPDAIVKISNEVKSFVTDHEAQSFLVGSLQTFIELAKPEPFQDVGSAIASFVSAVSHTIFHGPGDREFAAPTLWIQTSRESRVAQPAAELPEIFEPAIKCVRRYIIPALQGLERISLENQDGKHAQDCRQAWTKTLYLVSDLEAYLSSLKYNAMSLQNVAYLEDLWTSIKKNTQFGPPQSYLGRRIRKEEPSGVLEQVAPLLYCLPLNVANSTAQRWGTVRITADWQESAGHGVEAVLVQSALADVAELVDLLLEDARKHGVGEVSLRFDAMNRSDKRVQMIAENRVADFRSGGNGKSQLRVHELARKQGWQVDFPKSAVPGELFRAVVLLGEAFALGRG